MFRQPRSLVVGSLALLSLLTIWESAEACRRCRRCCPRAVVVADVVPDSVRPRAEDVLRSPKGVLYAITDFGERNAYLPEPRTLEELVLAAKDKESFLGTARRVAKTSIAAAPVEPFPGLSALLDSLPSDASMLSMMIGTGAKADRIAEEKRNVTVPTFLYAASKEDDNDWHLILGTAPGVSPRRLMNVEISGLPRGGPFREPLKLPRKQLRDFFGSSTPGMSYQRYNPPIPVQVTGSLFFDTSHPAGQVGPKGLRPATAWEIHPVTSIEFEP